MHLIVYQLLFVTFGYLVAALTAPVVNDRVHIFYYPWYQNPEHSKVWRHWNQAETGGRTPPHDVASNFYPTLGAYDSCDPKVLDQHMQWIASAGIGVVLTSWWGEESFEDKCSLPIMDAAHKHSLKVAFHIEIYGGRTAQSTASDIEYINKKYSTHAAYYRDGAHGNRPVFYIYSSVLIHDWTPIKGLLKDNILLGSTYNVPQPINHTEVLDYFTGFYPYGIGVDPQFMSVSGWKAMNDFLKSKSMLWSPSVGPGYIDNVAKPHTKATIFNRQNGNTYDLAWHNMFAAGIPDYVSITSFNEWHEGAIIEPASHSPPNRNNDTIAPYMTYNGAYGKTGKASETAYLERTLYWVNEFTKRTQSDL